MTYPAADGHHDEMTYGRCGRSRNQAPAISLGGGVDLWRDSSRS